MNAGTARSARVGPSHRGRADLGRILGVTRAEAAVRAGSVGIVRAIAATTTEVMPGRTLAVTKASEAAATRASTEPTTAAMIAGRHGRIDATAHPEHRTRASTRHDGANLPNRMHEQNSLDGGASLSTAPSARRSVNAMMRSKRQRTSDSTPKNGPSSKSAKPSVMPKLLVKMTCGPKPSERSIGAPWSPTNGTLPERNR